MASEFALAVREELARRFVDPAPEFDDTTDEIARFRSVRGAMGDVVLFDEGDGLIGIEGWTHFHAEGTDAEAIETCCADLELLFTDRALVWGTDAGGGGVETSAEGFTREYAEEELPEGAPYAVRKNGAKQGVLSQVCAHFPAWVT